jgi:ABC-type transporter Mla subunit MlaD
VLAILYVGSEPPSGTREIVAEFRDAFPTIEGMQVRTDGAISGSIGKIRVDDRGLAEVTLLVDKTIPAPRADATATIRQADSTGDSYIAYEPGTASKALPQKDGKGRIACAAATPVSPCANTLAAPRLDDLINAFGPPEQAGVKLILDNLSDAVAHRGLDINRAALDLVPALDAANHAVVEVNTQNAALKRLIGDMEAVSGQAASRRVELGRLIGSLARTLHTTADAAVPLDAGLRALPATETQLQSTFADLGRAADATRPLAAQLAAGAPDLGSLLDKAPGFLDDVRAALHQGGPTLDLTRKLLAAGAPTIEADPQRVVTGSFDLAPALSNLLKGILGGDETIKGFFGDETNGAPDGRAGFGFGLGAIASEPGNQAGYPGDWTTRNFVRFDPIINCQSFGVPVKPGCLASVLAADAPRRHRHPPAKAPRKPRPALKPVQQVTQVLRDKTKDALQKVPQKVKDLAKQLGGTVDTVTGEVDDTLGHPVDPPALNDLLDYLLG